MSEIKAFITLLDKLKQHDNDKYTANKKNEVDLSLLHNNVLLKTFYQQFDLKSLTIQTGVSSIRFIDYANLEERNNLYLFSSLKANEYLVFAEHTGGGNPVLFNFHENTNTPAIYAAYDILEPFKIADNLHQFIEALTALIDIVYNDYDIYEIYTTDDCDEIKPAFFTSLNMRLPAILGENMDNFMRYFFG